MAPSAPPDNTVSVPVVDTKPLYSDAGTASSTNIVSDQPPAYDSIDWGAQTAVITQPTLRPNSSAVINSQLPGGGAATRIQTP